MQARRCFQNQYWRVIGITTGMTSATKDNWYDISNEGMRERELDFSTLRAGGIALKSDSAKIQDGHTLESPVFGAQIEEEVGIAK